MRARGIVHNIGSEKIIGRDTFRNQSLRTLRAAVPPFFNLVVRVFPVRREDVVRFMNFKRSGAENFTYLLTAFWSVMTAPEMLRISVETLRSKGCSQWV